MIRVHLTVIVFLYLTAFLMVIAGASLLDARRRARRARRALHFRLRCAICGFEFEDRSPAPAGLSALRAAQRTGGRGPSLTPDVFSFFSSFSYGHVDRPQPQSASDLRI